ncbi:alanine racemase [Oscillospiraceae bacterium HV4-5-C5C]|nr:alanine racemase [Oscillospiraceae bacterium HV4-5-C5C]
MIKESYIVNRTWAEVNLDALADNVKAIRQQVWKGTEMMAVVKADAYGHGVAAVVPRLLEAGADRLAVSMLDEAIELRESGVTAPILILSYTDPRRAEEIVRYNITQTVYSWDLIQALDRAADRLGRLASVHIKIDTGMGRVGFTAGFDTVETVKEVAAMPHISVDGIFTHFATADEADTAYTRQQFNRFISLCQELERSGIFIPIKHCCNSAATLRFPEMQLDMVRPGLILYGQLPDACQDFAPLFKPAMTLKSNLIMVKQLPENSSISYGRIFTTRRPSRIGTVPIGYADGYSRNMNGKAEVLVHGYRVPVVGSICMDACMVDLTDIPEEVHVGDEVVIFGSQARADGTVSSIEVSELAAWQGTITYEVLCVIGKRVPRVYKSQGKTVAVYSGII